MSNVVYKMRLENTMTLKHGRGLILIKQQYTWCPKPFKVKLFSSLNNTTKKVRLGSKMWNRAWRWTLIWLAITSCISTLSVLVDFRVRGKLASLCFVATYHPLLNLTIIWSLIIRANFIQLVWYLISLANMNAFADQLMRIY